jgi:LPS O-antigen subunit length determinant protein (WzzB/FepE family)
MKKNKWFILAALIGLVLSTGFVMGSCSIFDNPSCGRDIRCNI